MGDVGEYWREAKQDRKMAEWRSSMFGGKDGTHKCRHPECRAQIPSRLYACAPHWRALPRGIKSQIVQGYRNSATVWFRGHENAQDFWKGGGRGQ